MASYSTYTVVLKRDATGRVEEVYICTAPIDGEAVVLNTLRGSAAYEFYKSLEGDIKTWAT